MIIALECYASYLFIYLFIKVTNFYKRLLPKPAYGMCGNGSHGACVKENGIDANGPCKNALLPIYTVYKNTLTAAFQTRLYYQTRAVYKPKEIINKKINYSKAKMGTQKQDE